MFLGHKDELNSIGCLHLYFTGNTEANTAIISPDQAWNKWWKLTCYFQPTSTDLGNGCSFCVVFGSRSSGYRSRHYCLQFRIWGLTVANCPIDIWSKLFLYAIPCTRWPIQHTTCNSKDLPGRCGLFLMASISVSLSVSLLRLCAYALSIKAWCGVFPSACTVDGSVRLSITDWVYDLDSWGESFESW